MKLERSEKRKSNSDYSRPNIREMRSFLKVTKMAIVENAAKGLIKAKG